LLVVHRGAEIEPEGVALLERLNPFLIDRVERSEWISVKLASGAVATVCRFRFQAESADVLRRAADRLSDWQLPRLPEDLSLLRPDGSVWFASISHEPFGYFELSPGEREHVEAALPELGRLILRSASSHLCPDVESRVNAKAIHLLPEESRELEELRIAAEGDGFHWFRIQTVDAVTEGDLVNALNDGFRCPTNSIEDWDDLTAALRDLSWLPGRWYVCEVPNADQLLLTTPDGFHRFVTLAWEVSAFWWDRRVPLHWVLRGGIPLRTYDYDWIDVCRHGETEESC
jgi:hypothetical protein